MLRHAKTKKLMLFTAMVGIIVALLSSCSGLKNEKDVYASSQFYTCIYDHEDGTVQNLPPGGGRKTVEDDAEVWLVPTSQRFWAVDTDETVRDPGAPAGIAGRDSNYKDVVMNARVEFFVNQAKACELVDRHLKRNVQADAYDDDDDESNQKMGYNVRGAAAAGEPWFIFLNEKFSTTMVKQGKPLLSRYSWEYYEFEYAVNADTNGKLKCGEVSEDCQPGERATDVIAPEFGQLVTDKLREQLGGDYFCGAGYDPKKPDVCPPLLIEVRSVSLVDKAPLKARQKLVSLNEQAENDRREADLTAQATEAAVAKEKAKLEQDQKMQALIDSYGGIDPGVAEAQRTAELERIKAKGAADVAQEKARAEAAKDVAICISVGAKGDECARIIAALKGQYPQGGGTSVQVNPGK